MLPVPPPPWKVGCKNMDNLSWAPAPPAEEVEGGSCSPPTPILEKRAPQPPGPRGSPSLDYLRRNRLVRASDRLLYLQTPRSSTVRWLHTRKSSGVLASRLPRSSPGLCWWTCLPTLWPEAPVLSPAPLCLEAMPPTLPPGTSEGVFCVSIRGCVVCRACFP